MSEQLCLLDLISPEPQPEPEQKQESAGLPKIKPGHCWYLCRQVRYATTVTGWDYGFPIGQRVGTVEPDLVAQGNKQYAYGVVVGHLVLGPDSSLIVWDDEMNIRCSHTFEIRRCK